MKLNLQQLETHLAKNLNPKNLNGPYLVCGDEALLVQEAMDLIRTTAKKSGFSERTRIAADTQPDWGNLLFSQSQSLSLFSEKRLIELDLSNIKFSAANTKILQETISQLSPDILLLVRTQKLDSKTEQTVWFKTMEKSAVFIPVWPIPIEQLPQWIMQRAKKFQLTFSKIAADRLAECVEGNLLAAAQEIEKLALLHTGNIDIDIIENTLTDHAHFDIFALIDSVLLGNKKRSLRILDNLAAEDTEPAIILWAFTRELRTLSEMFKQKIQGVSLPQIFSQFRVWEKRQPVVRAFLQRHSQQKCWDCLSDSAAIDCMIKGAEKGNIWNDFQKLILKMV
jgi:DNA polymerase-3 subunit delta